MPAKRESLDMFGRTALAAAIVGAIGSVALTVRAGRTTPHLLLVAMTIWVGAPFVALAYAVVMSPRWSSATRTTLYTTVVLLTLACLFLYYADERVRPAHVPRAFLFVLAPPVSLLITALASAISSVRQQPPQSSDD